MSSIVDIYIILEFTKTWMFYGDGEKFKAMIICSALEAIWFYPEIASVKVSLLSRM
jgi:hypothetical protein